MELAKENNTNLMRLGIDDKMVKAYILVSLSNGWRRRRREKVGEWQYEAKALASARIKFANARLSGILFQNRMQIQIQIFVLCQDCRGRVWGTAYCASFHFRFLMEL